MLIDIRLAAGAVGFLLAAMIATPVHAQSFLQSLFGQAPPKPVEALPPPTPSYRAPISVPRSRPSRSEEDDEVSSASRFGGAKVRTVCVRMCDGYYFPISSQTRQSRLTSDSLRCKAACGHEARLFYSTEGGDDPASMVDLTGRRYDAIQNAFSYRKKLTPGCACKPAPWSAEERMRHTRYAIERAEAIARLREAEATKLAAADGSMAQKDMARDKNGQSQTAATQPAGVASVAELVPANAPPADATEPGASGQGPESRSPGELAELQRTAARPSKRKPVQVESQKAATRPYAAAGKMARQVAAAPQGGGGGLFNFGKSKYVWPGDPR